VIRVIVFAVIGLVIGLGGGSGVAVMKAKKALAASHDSTAKADSTKHNAAVAEKGHEDEAKPAAPELPTVVAHTDAAPTAAAQVPATKHDSVVTPPVAVVKPPAVDTTHGASPAVPGRIAKIFGAKRCSRASTIVRQPRFWRAFHLSEPRRSVGRRSARRGRHDVAHHPARRGGSDARDSA
jgi:hypothetical protein